jgi:hypothetical protein
LWSGSVSGERSVREKAHIFAGSKGDYYEIAGDLPKYDTFPKK